MDSCTTLQSVNSNENVARCHKLIKSFHHLLPLGFVQNYQKANRANEEHESEGVLHKTDKMLNHLLKYFQYSNNNTPSCLHIYTFAGCI